MPGFFDTYEDSGGLNYIGQEEKAAMIKNVTPFLITSVWQGTGQFGPKYTVKVELDGEERAISFGAGKVESRDRFLDAVTEWLDQEDAEPPKCKLYKVKQSVLIGEYTDE